jgi:hypothetical protein
MATRLSLVRRLACSAETTRHFLRTAILPVDRSASDASLLDHDAVSHRPRVFVPTDSVAQEGMSRPQIRGRRAA